jgi:hypothetical protein
VFFSPVHARIRERIPDKAVQPRYRARPYVSDFDILLRRYEVKSGRVYFPFRSQVSWYIFVRFDANRFARLRVFRRRRTYRFSFRSGPIVYLILLGGKENGSTLLRRKLFERYKTSRLSLHHRRNNKLNFFNDL